MDVAYVPSFHANLVSFDRAWVKGVRWDTDNMTLKQGSKAICKVNRMHDQWVLEYNPPSAATDIMMTARAT
jgi:hypothetical protein